MQDDGGNVVCGIRQILVHIHFNQLCALGSLLTLSEPQSLHFGNKTAIIPTLQCGSEILCLQAPTAVPGKGLALRK